MSQVKTISGRGIPVLGNDIDTDRIIPARYLRCVTFDGLGENAFADDRAQLKGQHPFDLPQYQGATILVVNGNFGCGSSREHAPQAIAKWGIKAIIGESFAEIFFGNCLAIGVPCVTASPETIQKLQTILQENPQVSLTVDLEAMKVSYGDEESSIFIGEGPQKMLTTGTWDSCGQLIANAEQIQKTAANLAYMLWDNPVTISA
ncbi:MAG TPA: 3-isopropylmalate dehydratase small subunit [Cyanobacteria bacterium UBA11149]|nr:3-isopropylmalate dehydratase small subunit [Cyanobacteria bacterium UBA11367]HBE56917.1 3-isopropylmalate dehydratase small subunit [Cyanobacteria bacterium UBA11366]HBR73140.1 3-isopropylmalate dehydratase small subunit [Cyanobacteria bacterium UBA11159]HBS71720.1 3-isopropylmalate dehydratase small subunit [Cyanobacteria bacterium UBA11153]HBW91234.1 3-isopropylmalate dehydratase small subunit [Cyanobacteria bacterium UBA11149]